MSVAVFAGTFDPFTSGHLDIVSRVAARLDRIHVVLMDNPYKSSCFFSQEERYELIVDAVGGISNVTTDVFNGLLIDYCKSVKATFLIRGIRSGEDVAYERQLEAINKRLLPEIETFYVFAKPELSFLSSSLVRSLIKINVSIEGLVPNPNHIILQKGTNQYDKR